TDQQIKVVGMAQYNVGVGILHRNATKSGGPVVAINHERVSEVYYVVSGSGTLITGGTVTGVKPLPPDGYLVKVAVGPSNSGAFKASPGRHPRQLLAALACLFVGLGETDFVGPAVHIAILEHEVVRRRGWRASCQFLDLLGPTNLFPEPNSTEMSIHIGHARA